MSNYPKPIWQAPTGELHIVAKLEEGVITDVVWAIRKDNKAMWCSRTYGIPIGFHPTHYFSNTSDYTAYIGGRDA